MIITIICIPITMNIIIVVAVTVLVVDCYWMNFQVGKTVPSITKQILLLALRARRHVQTVLVNVYLCF